MELVPLNDEDSRDVMDNMTDLLATLNPEDNLTGFCVVMEWMDPEGARSLALLKSPSTPPWELQGWLYHMLRDSEQMNAVSSIHRLLAALADDDEDEDDDDGA